MDRENTVDATSNKSSWFQVPDLGLFRHINLIPSCIRDVSRIFEIHDISLAFKEVSCTPTRYVLDAIASSAL